VTNNETEGPDADFYDKTMLKEWVPRMDSVTQRWVNQTKPDELQVKRLQRCNVALWSVGIAARGHLSIFVIQMSKLAQETWYLYSISPKSDVL